MKMRSTSRRTLMSAAVVALFGACSRSLSGTFEPPEPPDGSQGNPKKKCAAECEKDMASGDRIAESANTGDGTVAPGNAGQSDQDAAGASITKTLVGLKIAIDVGHSASGSDRGAFGDWVAEYKLNVEEANLLAKKLRDRGAFVSLFHYPNTTELDERGRNAAGHHIFLSIHHNAFSNRSTQGTEVLINHPDHSANDQRLASTLQGALMGNIWGSSANEVLNRGARAQSLGVLRNAPKSVMAACLSEAFFITENGMTESKARGLVVKAAEGLATGIEKYWLATKSKMFLLDGSDHSDFSSEHSTIGNYADPAETFVAWPLSTSDEELAGMYEGH